MFISCGEASGDRYGAALTAALRSLAPDIKISAMGGPEMVEAGAEIIQDYSSVSVMGISEAVGALPEILRVRRKLTKYIESENVDMVVPIDFPGFNGHIGRKARQNDIPVFWVVAPQHWAWGSWRTSGFRSRVTRLGTILPFETDYFRSRGLEVFPMGHPLMDDYGPSFSFEKHLGRREKVFSHRNQPLTIGVFPGSRKQELKHLLPVLRVSCQALNGHLVDRRAKFIVSAAPGVDPIDLANDFDLTADISQAPLKEILPDIDLALVCSGTASLEVALSGVPHELVYKTGSLNNWIGRKLLKTQYIGLSNIIMDEEIVREHLQEDAAPLPLARDLLRWLARPAEREQYYRSIRELRKTCGEPGVWLRTASAILGLDSPSGRDPSQKGS